MCQTPARDGASSPVLNCARLCATFVVRERRLTTYTTQLVTPPRRSAPEQRYDICHADREPDTTGRSARV